MRSRWWGGCKLSVIGTVCMLGSLSPGFSDDFQCKASYQLCFTPQNNCTAKIVHSITQAQSTIYVQAYSFSSKPILYALMAAKKRGVVVKVILDKSHLAHPQWGYQLAQVGVPVWIDRPTGIAHNKVMVLDRHTVITGSFNFSYSAQYKNRENVLFIKDKHLADRYLANWKACQLQSSPLVYEGKPFKTTHWMDATNPLLQAGVIISGLILIWTIFGPP